MISAVVLEALEDLATLKSPNAVTQVHSIQMMHMDAVEIINAFRAITALQGLLSRDEFTVEAVGRIIDQIRVAPVDVGAPRKVRGLTEMTMNRETE